MKGFFIMSVQSQETHVVEVSLHDFQVPIYTFLLIQLPVHTHGTFIRSDTKSQQVKKLMSTKLC